MPQDPHSSACHKASKPTIIASAGKWRDPRDSRLLLPRFHSAKRKGSAYSSVPPSPRKIPSPLPHFGAPRPRSPPVSLLPLPRHILHPLRHINPRSRSPTPQPPSCILIRGTCDLSQVFLVLLRPCFRFSFLHWCKVFFFVRLYICICVYGWCLGAVVYRSLPCLVLIQEVQVFLVAAALQTTRESVDKPLHPALTLVPAHGFKPNAPRLYMFVLLWW